MAAEAETAPPASAAAPIATDDATAGWANGGAGWEDSDADWCVGRSDGEEEPAEGWAPPPPEIRRLLEQLAQRGNLPLRQPIRRRRPPTPPPRCPPRQPPPEQHPEPPPPENKPPVVPEFEFADEPASPTRALIPRRRPHGPPGRVCRRAALDKVLWDMKRHQALEQQILRTGRDLFPPGARPRKT